MFLNILIANIFIVFASNAQTIQVSSHKTNFVLVISDAQNLSIKGHQINMKINKNSCNEYIIDNFISKTKLLTKTKPMSKTKQKGLFKVVIDDNEYYENPRSKVGHNLIYIPKEFQRMKIQEKMLCLSK